VTGRPACRTSLLIVLVSAGPVFAASSLPDPLPLDVYIQRLATLKQAIANLDTRDPQSAGRLSAGLEDGWSVRAGDRVFHVPAAWLHSGLTQWARRPSPEARARLVGELHLLSDEAAAFEETTGDPHDRPEARAQLARILAQKEFRNVRPPTVFDDLRRRVGLWLLTLFSRLLGSATASSIGDGAAYGLVALVAALVILVMVRLLRSAVARDVQALSASSRATAMWTPSIEEAHRAATQGAWRDAVRLAYWSGLACLEGRGFWRADGSRTPREYLRLVPAGDEPGTSLGAFTRLFERVWYAKEPAGPADFTAALEHFERLKWPAR
jgi:hypothetical protein